AEFKVTADTTRGLDHGVWVPLKVAIPKPKDLPIVQVSLTSQASYEYNIKVGRALAPLRDEGILIICSDVLPYVIPFERDLDKILIDSKGKEREKQLIKLIDHPLLRQAHPTDDHFVLFMSQP
ncbi:1493_t:CDS:2, partial [Gigaspora margarita]